MNPTISDLHVDAALTDVSVAYSQADTRFVARRVFPVVPVTKQSDKYFEYNRGDWFRSEAKPRAPGAEAAEGGWKLSLGTYFCDRFALRHPVSDPERANADPAVSNLDADATDYLTQQLLIRDEKDWVSTNFTTSVWTGASSTSDMTGSSTTPASTAANFLQWNDVASTPIEDIAGEHVSVSQRTGQVPNTLVLGAHVYRHLANHPDILDRIKYTQAGIVTPDLLAALFDVERVLISRAAENTAAEGATDVFSFVAGKHALLCYVAPRPGLRVPSAGYTFVWTGMPGAPAQGARIKRYRIESKESDIIEAELWRDQKVIGAALGAFFSGATA